MKLILVLMMSLFMVNAMGQEYTSPFNHSLMAEKYYDLIVENRRVTEPFITFLTLHRMKETARQKTIKASLWSRSMW